MDMDIKSEEKDKITAIEWKTFWDSKVGKKLMGKLAGLKQSYLESSMVVPQDEIARMIDRALGIDSVIQFIQVGIEKAKKELKEEGAK